MAHGCKTKIEQLSHIKGLRAWTNELDELPDVAAALLKAANRLQVTPVAILFDFCDGQWGVVLHGDD
jgi:hypothetical protein